MFRKKSTTLFLLLLILCLTVVGASAHDWYDRSCCSGQDCHPIPCEEIIEKSKSLFYKGWEFFGQSIKPSQDGLCHVCISNEFSKEFTPVPHCIYIQQNS